MIFFEFYENIIFSINLKLLAYLMILTISICLLVSLFYLLLRLLSILYPFIASENVNFISLFGILFAIKVFE